MSLCVCVCMLASEGQRNMVGGVGDDFDFLIAHVSACFAAFSGPQRCGPATCPPGPPLGTGPAPSLAGGPGVRKRTLLPARLLLPLCMILGECTLGVGVFR